MTSRIALIALLLMPCTCLGDLILYGMDQSTSQLITLDSSTGAGTAIGATGVNRIAGIAVGQDGTIYASADINQQLVTLNPSTGAATVVGAFGFAGVRDLAFDNLGQLYGFDDGNNQLIRIDTATGAGTAVSTVALTDVSGLAFDSSGILYASDFINGNLLTINPNTGAHVVVGAFGSGTNAILSLAFDSTGTLFGADAGATDSLYRINLSTGAATSVGPTGFTHVSGVAFSSATVPEPGSVTAVNLLLLSTTLYRRRRVRKAATQ